jgi:hypothetical protein
MTLVNSQGAALEKIASQSVDSPFAAYFLARDRFNNVITLDVNSRQSTVFMRDAFRPRTKDGSLDMRFNINKGGNKNENFI